MDDFIDFYFIVEVDIRRRELDIASDAVSRIRADMAVEVLHNGHILADGIYRPCPGRSRIGDNDLAMSVAVRDDHLLDDVLSGQPGRNDTP